MALSQSAVSELLEAFRTGEGVDLIRESVRMVSPAKRARSRSWRGGILMGRCAGATSSLRDDTAWPRTLRLRQVMTQEEAAGSDHHHVESTCPTTSLAVADC